MKRLRNMKIEAIRVEMSQPLHDQKRIRKVNAVSLSAFTQAQGQLQICWFGYCRMTSFCKKKLQANPLRLLRHPDKVYPNQTLHIGRNTKTRKLRSQNPCNTKCPEFLLSGNENMPGGSTHEPDVWGKANQCSCSLSECCVYW